MREERGMPKTLILAGKIVGGVTIFYLAAWLAGIVWFLGIFPKGEGLGGPYPREAWHVWVLFFITLIYVLPLPASYWFHWRKSFRWATMPLFAAGIVSLLFLLVFLGSIVEEGL